jgi:hypothetical protein
MTKLEWFSERQMLPDRITGSDVTAACPSLGIAQAGDLNSTTLRKSVRSAKPTNREKRMNDTPRPLDTPDSPEMVMPKDQVMQEVLADVAKTRPEYARVMAKMAVEGEQSLELHNLLRRPFAIVIGAALFLALASVAAMYAFGEQSKSAQYVQVAALVLLWLVGCWAVFRGRTS